MTRAEVRGVKLFFLPDQNYDCVQCGRSCSGWRVHVDPVTEERIAGSPVVLRIIEERGKTQPIEVDPADGSKILPRKADGTCVYLNEDRLCSIHAELGYQDKPVGCRQFPFQFTLTPDGVYVGISFSCTAAQQNVGRPLPAHEEDLRELLGLFRPAGWEGNLKLCGVSQAELDWPTYLEVEKLVAEHGPARALMGLAELAGFAPPGEIPAPAFDVAFRRAAPERLDSDELLMESTRFFLASLLGSIEAPAEEARGVTELLMLDRPVTLPGSRWEGTWAELRAAAMPPEFDLQVERYRRALLHRKFLTRVRPLLENVVALYLLEPMLRFYTAVYAAGGPADITHLYRAFDRLELELFTHTTSAGLDMLLGAFAQAYAEILQTGG